MPGSIGRSWGDVLVFAGTQTTLEFPIFDSDGNAVTINPGDTYELWATNTRTPSDQFRYTNDQFTVISTTVAPQLSVVLQAGDTITRTRQVYTLQLWKTNVNVSVGYGLLKILPSARPVSGVPIIGNLGLSVSGLLVGIGTTVVPADLVNITLTGSPPTTLTATPGTVQSVGVSTGSSGVTVSESPVTTSGTITLNLGTAAAHAATDFVAKSGDTMTGPLTGTSLVLSGLLTANGGIETNGGQIDLANGSIVNVADSRGNWDGSGIDMNGGLIFGVGTLNGLTFTAGSGTLTLNTFVVTAAKSGTIAMLSDLVGYENIKGLEDCSANPNYPAGASGDTYYVSVAGKIGGASGKSVLAGDVFICVIANAGGTQASVGADWVVLNRELGYVPANAATTITINGTTLDLSANRTFTVSASNLSGLGTGVATALAANQDGSTASAVGYLGIPQNSESTAYTFAATDHGKHVYHPPADTTGRTWTIPANSAVALPIGFSCLLVNDIGAGTITVSINTDTLVMETTGSTGARTLAAGGSATLLKVASTRWLISGGSSLT